MTSSPLLIAKQEYYITNPVFGKISDTVRSASGQRSSGGKTSNPKNLSLLAHVGDSEGHTSETVPQGVKEPSQRADGEQRPQTRKLQPSGIDQGPSQGRNRCLYCSRNHALEDCQYIAVEALPRENSIPVVQKGVLWMFIHRTRRKVLPAEEKLQDCEL